MAKFGELAGWAVESCGVVTYAGATEMGVALEDGERIKGELGT